MSTTIQRVAVCGAGAMGSGIAQVAAQAGSQVVVFDTSEDALEAGRQRVLKSLDALKTRGKLSADDAQAIAGRVIWSTDIAAIAGTDLAIEAIVEQAEIKADLFARIETVVAGDTVIATNTSSLPISRLARTLGKPERFVGMHFFNPAPAMKLVEIVAGAATAPEVADAVRTTAGAWGKVAVPVADVPGFIVNRVARPYYAEAFAALAEKAAPPQLIDALFRDAAGFRMGPLELTDLIGQDVNFAVARSVYDGYFGRTRFIPQLAQAALVDAGHLGQKTGRGVYRHGQNSDARTPIVPSVAPPIVIEVPDDGFAEIDGVLVGLSRGRLAASEARDAGKPVALFDWANEGGALAFSATSDAAAEIAVAVATGKGRAVHRIADRPGLIVLRTLAQIANAAADAVLEQVADEMGVDNALRYGANYPFGLFAWADRFGRRRLQGLLAAIAGETGHSLYRPSEYWARSL